MKTVRTLQIITFLLVIVAALATVVPAFAQGPDPVGTATFEADPNSAVNFVWVLVTAFLVFFMQAGFALVETGMTRAKNTVNIMSKNFMDFCIGGLAFWAFGFALMFGGSAVASGLSEGNAVIGLSGFFLTGEANDVSTMLLWFFQMVFAATAATIVSGAMAERTKLSSYMAYSFLVSAIVYPIYGHWVWGGGWLWTLPFGSGARDFAGSGVVHAVGGFVALAGAYLVGPRIGKFDKTGKPRTIPGHNIGYVVLGVIILFFGWFGFNPGSTLLATDLRISVIAVNTFLAGVAGAVVAMYYSMTKTGKGDITVACNGALAGLVGITAPCAYVSPWASVIIGIIAAFVMLGAVSFVENRLKVDDPVGAIAVHGFAGVWGLLALGIFADGTYGDVSGALYGNFGQLIAQIISSIVVVAWSLGAGFAIFYLLKKTMGLRVPESDELKGLDTTEHGIEAYGGDVMTA